MIQGNINDATPMPLIRPTVSATRRTVYRILMAVLCPLVPAGRAFMVRNAAY